MRNNQMPAPPRSPARQHGVTLVEVIVALLLLASFTIGIAAIYTQRQNMARGGWLHERAVELAQQIAAPIRENSGKTSFETAVGNTCNAQPGKSGKPASSKTGSAANVVACWQDLVESELTNGSANISLDRTTVPAQYVIVVSWSEPRSGTASYVLRVTPGSARKPEAITAGAARAAG